MDRIRGFVISCAAFLVLHSLPPLIRVVEANSVDQYAIVSLKESITVDPNQITIKNWSANASVCSWIGVTCNLRHHRVAQLTLVNMGLVGTIPPQLGNLSFLVYLDLGGNEFHGGLPLELGNLHRLKVMNFSNNFLSGTIPTSFTLLPKLEQLLLANNAFTGKIPEAILNISTLEALGLHVNKLSGHLPEEICHHVANLRLISLDHNDLTGTIPPTISRCTQLQILSLHDNNLTGPIPREVGNLTLLEVLSLFSNKFEGFIPEEIGSIRGLQKVDLHSNSFSGSIPTTLFNITTLRKLSLAQNHLSGRLPSNIGSNMPNLETLYLDLNDLVGVIPESISNSSILKFLDLSANKFTGRIPNALGNLMFLQELTLNQNNLEADQELSFFTSLTRCRYLREVSVGGNPLNGVLPTSIGNITNLEFLEASLCGIKGYIPDHISNLSKLTLISLSHNELGGYLPYEFKRLTQLQGLACNHNNIGGPIPTSLCNLRNLALLNLNSNQILGKLPNCLGNLTSLRNLFLGYNKLTSSLPASLWKLKDIIYLNLTSNHLNGSISPEVESLKVVIQFDISDNEFTGYIPSTINEMQNLISMSLANNKFQGTIPESIGKLVGLEMLDLSNNSLTGTIPKSLEALQHLRQFNVSFNRLTGEIPNGGPFRNFTYLCFMANDGFCGELQFHVPFCQGSSSKKSTNKKMLLVILVPIVATSTTIVLAVFLLFRYCRRLVEARPDSLPNIIPERISYYQLQRATDGFHDSNLLGKGSFGSVFKGLLADGTCFAVKVFHLQLEGAFKSFETECAVLRNLRHRNLTKVISSCSNPNFKALVLEYIPNGSLDKWLYFDGHFLDVIQRLNIMTDVACAIEYLHHGYSSPVVHCDLKPCNVLIDKDMVGRVSDFGISKLLGEEETIRHTTTLATFGYMAPEYGGEGMVSTRCDVYSYGILLMETFTRRRPNDEMFSEDLSLRSWVSNSVPNAIDQVVDVSLISLDEKHLSEKLDCISSIMNMAVYCSTKSPKNRPTMKDVVACLQKVKIKLQKYC